MLSVNALILFECWYYSYIDFLFHKIIMYAKFDNIEKILQNIQNEKYLFKYHMSSINTMKF